MYSDRPFRSDYVFLPFVAFSSNAEVQYEEFLRAIL